MKFVTSRVFTVLGFIPLVVLDDESKNTEHLVSFGSYCRWINSCYYSGQCLRLYYHSWNQYRACKVKYTGKGSHWLTLGSPLVDPMSNPETGEATTVLTPILKTGFQFIRDFIWEQWGDFVENRTNINNTG